MIQATVTVTYVKVTHCAFDRERCDRLTDCQCEVTYQVWLVCQRRDEPVSAPSRVLVDPSLRADAAEKYEDRLQKAIAKVAADRTEKRIWKSAGDLSGNQAFDLITKLPDAITEQAEKLLEAPGAAVRLPPIEVSLGAETAAALVLEPVLEPIEIAVLTIEVIGVVIGTLTGPHGLAIYCIKHLAYSKLGDVLTSTFNHVIDEAKACATQGVVRARVSASETTETAEVVTTVATPETEKYFVTPRGILAETMTEDGEVDNLGSVDQAVSHLDTGAECYLTTATASKGSQRINTLV